MTIDDPLLTEQDAQVSYLVRDLRPFVCTRSSTRQSNHVGLRLSILVATNHLESHGVWVDVLEGSPSGSTF